jgi:ABC-type lipoprotein export system ATPase subunit
MAEKILQGEGLVLEGTRQSEAFDVTVRAGELWLVSGPPGAGKSTLLKTLAGLTSPVAGEITLFGNRLSLCPPRVLARIRQRLGIVFEGDGLISAWTVYESLALPFIYHAKLPPGTEQQWVEQAAANFGLPRDWMSVPVYKLHRNERHAVALIRAMMGNPELLIIDGLSIETLYTFENTGLGLLRQPLEQGVAMLLNTTFDMTGVIPDRAYNEIVMDGGRVISSGTVGPLSH